MAKSTIKAESAGKKGSPAKAGGAADEMSALALANKELEDEQRAQTGSQSSFISLAVPGAGVLDKNNPAFMKGVKELDYVIASKKLRPGKPLDVTVLGTFLGGVTESMLHLQMSVVTSHQ